jgi:hypothetical protein
VLAVDGTDSDAIDAIIDLARKISSPQAQNQLDIQELKEKTQREVLQRQQEEQKIAQELAYLKKQEESRKQSEAEKLNQQQLTTSQQIS